MIKNRALGQTFVLLGMATLPLIVPVGAQQFSDHVKKIGYQLRRRPEPEVLPIACSRFPWKPTSAPARSPRPWFFEGLGGG